MLFLEAFGQLSRHSDPPNTVAAEGDLYSVFSARADMMGWSTSQGTSSSPRIAGPREHGVLWWMHEAELYAGIATSRIGWAQVGLEPGVEPLTALPAMIQCLDDALRRFGVVELSGLQLTASHLQPDKGSIAWDLVSWLSWFNTGAGTRAKALVALDEGLLRGRSDADLLQSLMRMNGGAFDFGPLLPVPREHSIEVAAEAPIDAVLSPADRGVSVGLPEWSASAAAWALAFVLETALAGRPGTSNFAARLTRVA